MTQKTDGHIQYNGGWKFYLTLQPGLSCEFSDHRTCKESSERHDAQLALRSQEEIDAEKATQAANVDAAAATAKKDAQTARVNKAGQLKHEATRQNGLAKVNALAKIEKKCAEDLTKAQAAYDSECLRARTVLDADADAIIKASIAKQEEINATDFLALVVAEEAANAAVALEAAQADADAKAAQEAADAAAKLAETPAPTPEGADAEQP